MLAAEEVRRTKRRERDEARRAADTQSDAVIEQRVWDRLGRGGHRFSEEGDFFVSDVAFRAMKDLIRSDGDVSVLQPAELVALRLVGVRPADRTTWFIRRSRDL